MSVPVRLVAFAAVLVLSAGGGYVLGNAVGPIDEPVAETPHGPVDEGGAGHGGPSHGEGGGS
jgi:hypothetical protein